MGLIQLLSIYIMLNISRTTNFFKKIAAATIMAALLVTLVPVQVLVAEAASTIFTDSGVAVDRNTPYESTSIDVSGFSNLEVVLHYDSELLDKNDSFTYGWTDDGGEQVLGSVSGKDENASPGSATDEIGDKTEIFVAGAGTGKLFVRVTANSDEPADQMVIVTIDLMGDEEAPDPNLDATKISICHATASHQNPYESPKPDDGAKIVSGHGGHNGPVWFDGITVAWGDIIPPFTWYEKVGHGKDAVWEAREYLGKNWTAAGQAIWNNDCEIPPNNADLSITKVVSSETPFEGATVTYTLTVTNNGPAVTTSAVVTDPLAAGLTYVSASIAPTATAPLTWNLPVLASGETWTVDVVVTVGADQGGSSITNTATVSGTPNDPVGANNTDSTTILPVDVTIPVPGCTDVDAKNYSQLATTDDGSCLFELTVNKVIVGNTNVEADEFAFTVNGAVATNFNANGTAVTLVPNGDYTIVEVVAPGFAVSYDNCAPAVVNGAPATCTITNTVVTVEPPACRVGDNLLQNGSFETPVVTGDWGIFSTVANWTISLSDGLELWRNFMGGASHGAQNAELDGNTATRISQSVVTIPGATYALRYDFSPRPNTTLANNVVEVSVDGVPLMAASGDGMALTATQWTTQGGTFVASATSTTIGFEDKGIGSVSYGSLIDNAVLCFVSAPVPKLCSIVSDETTLVDGVASTITWEHPLWTDELTSGEWIWDATVEPTNGETVTFTKTFFVDNAPTGATLKVAVDNRYTATLNGNPLTCDGTGENNFTVADTCAAPVVSGLNTLTFVVTNDPYATTDAHTNPSGLIYELTIDGATCSAVPDDTTPDVDTYRLEGYVWHDDNANTIWEEEGEVIEVPLSGWTVKATMGETTYSTTTDEFGYYYFDVPAGTWTISQEVQTDWEQTTTPVVYEVTVPSETAQSFVEQVLAYIIPVAHAALVETIDDLDFGNDFVGTAPTPTTSSSSGGGGGGRLVRSTPTVAGDSISTPSPMPMVLGEQVSAVPYGAPGTGHGGASSTANTLTLLQILFVSRKRELVK